MDALTKLRNCHARHGQPHPLWQILDQPLLMVKIQINKPSSCPLTDCATSIARLPAGCLSLLDCELDHGTPGRTRFSRAVESGRSGKHTQYPRSSVSRILSRAQITPHSEPASSSFPSPPSYYHTLFLPLFFHLFIFTRRLLLPFFI